MNWRLLRLYLAQWVLTIPAVGLMTAAVFSYGVQYLAAMCQLLIAWCSQPPAAVSSRPAVDAMPNAVAMCGAHRAAGHMSAATTLCCMRCFCCDVLVHHSCPAGVVC